MLDEKHLGYCSACADSPPFYRDEKISTNLLYNPWCLFCYRNVNEDPSSFWPAGKLGRFSFECECGQNNFGNGDTSPKFGQALVDHFFAYHRMYISDALIKAGTILKEKTAKYLASNPGNQ